MNFVIHMDQLPLRVDNHGGLGKTVQQLRDDLGFTKAAMLRCNLAGVEPFGRGEEGLLGWLVHVSLLGKLGKSFTRLLRR